MSLLLLFLSGATGSGVVVVTTHLSAKPSIEVIEFIKPRLVGNITGLNFSIQETTTQYNDPDVEYSSSDQVYGGLYNNPNSSSLIAISDIEFIKPEIERII